MNNVNRTIIKYIFSFLGFIIIIIFIYINFIKERLPKDIPFILTEFKFWSLVYICCIYFIIIKQLLYPSYSKKFFLQKFISYIGKPFILFDSSIKYHTAVYPYYINFLFKIIPKINDLLYEDYVILIFFLQIIPRLILVTIFFVDVFIIITS